jgi:DNA-binding NarL/FixJ family response regulator
MKLDRTLAMSESRKIRVLIADDHQVVRIGLRAIIDAEPDMQVVAEAADGTGAIAAFTAHQPDITLLDLRMPVLSGAHVITDPQLAARLMDRINERSLTAREIAVLGAVARGMTNREIAAVLAMGEETVKAHLKHIFSKLDVRDRTEAALIAVQRGLIRL